MYMANNCTHSLACAHVHVCMCFNQQAKAAGNANNDWKLSHRLILQKLQEKQLAEEEMPSYEQVRDVFEEIYQGGLWKTEDLIIDPSLLQRLHDGGVRMVRNFASLSCHAPMDCYDFLSSERCVGMNETVFFVAGRRPL